MHTNFETYIIGQHCNAHKNSYPIAKTQKERKSNKTEYSLQVIPNSLN